MGIAYAPNVYVFLAFGTLFGFSTVYCGYAIDQIYITRWFVTNRGVMSGIVGLAELAGTMLFSFIVAGYLKTGQIGKAAQITAIIIFAVCPIDGLFFMKGFPEDYGLLPIGGEKVDASAPKGEVPGIPYSQAIRSSTLWIF